MAGDNKPSLVALRDTRERTIEALTEHFAHDVLDLEEYEDRVDRAHRAASVAELEQLVSDLEPVDPPSEALVKQEPETAMTVSRPESKKLITIMGGTDRKGTWVVPRKLNVFTVMGGTDLDFREAQLAPGVTEVKVRAIMGGVDIIVPPNVAVEAEGFAIMGGFDDMHRAPATPDPDRPLLRISGFALMGGFGISTRLPNESRWQAIKRRRRERRELAAKAQKQLTEGTADKQLSDGDKQLSDGDKQLTDADKQLTDADKQLTDADK